MIKAFSFIASALLGGALLSQAAETNLLPQDGSLAKAPGSLKPEGWKGDFGKGASVLEDSEGPYLRLSNSHPSASVSAGVKDPLAIPPATERVLVKGKVNVVKVEPGKESWHDARIAITFKRPDGSVAAHNAVAWSAPTNGWTDFSKELDVPEGASEFGFSPAIFNAVAELELRGLKVFALKSSKDEISWTLDDAWREKSSSRERICLNGVWKIKLMPGAAFVPDDPKSPGSRKSPDLEKTLAASGPWTQIRTPGQWYCSHWSLYTWSESLLYTKGQRGPQPGICNQVKYDGKLLKDLCCAWYEREFKLPEGWDPKSSFLKFDQFDLEAWVYVNGALVAYQESGDAKEIPLPETLKAGDDVKLNVLVLAEADGMEQIVMGGGDSYLITKKRESVSRGMSGDVWLLKHPSARAEAVRLSASTREKALKLRFQLPGSDALKGGKLELEVSSWKDGKAERLFKSALDGAQRLQDGSLEFSFPWADARLWSPEDPFLHVAKLRLYGADGRLADETGPVRFGFREIWIDGKDYMLNGSPVHFFRFLSGSLPKAAALSLFAQYRAIGFNCVHLYPGTFGSVDLKLDPKPFLEAADESGMLVVLQVPTVNDYSKIWDKGGREKWLSKAMPVVRDAWNSPSVVHWAMNFNLFGNAFDLFPEAIGIETNRNYGPLGAIGLESERMLLGFDPSRPVLHHAGGSIGQVHTSNIYLNFVQPQEKYEWLLPFKERAVKPFFAVELGMPYPATYFYGRKNFGEVDWTEPMLAEYAAMRFGESAFSRTGELLKDICSAKVERGAISSGCDKYVPKVRMRGELFNESQSLLAEFMKYWRASGVGGMHPWAPVLWDEREQFGAPASYESLKTPGIKTLFTYEIKLSGENALCLRYKELLSPLIAFVGGPDGKFSERRRNYMSGSKISKSAVVVNDSPKAFEGEIRARLLLDGKELSSTSLKASVPKGRCGLFDFALDAPALDRKAQAIVEISSADGSFKDSFEIRLFPKAASASPRISRKLWLLDPQGASGKELTAKGLDFSAYSGEALGPGDLLIVGREGASACKPFAKEIRSSVMSGANMLVFEHSEKDLASFFGLRSFAASSRQLFVSASASSLLPGFESRDFMDWAGKATLLQENPTPLNESYPEHIWKRGNGGVVASVAIEKPQTGSFIPLLNEGCDLNYSPLLLINCGKGSALFCQLDLHGRTEQDPSASLVYARVLELASAYKAPASGKLAYSGDAKGSTLLDRLGVDFELSESPSPLSLWAIGEGSKALEGDCSPLKEFLAKGGRAVLLNHSSPSASAAKLGLQCADFKMDSFALPYKSLGALTASLSAADFYWKDNSKLPLPESYFPLKEFKSGAGSLLLCQIDPLQFSAEEMNQRRYAGRLKMFRCLSGVLAAGGASWKETCLDFLKGAGQGSFDLSGTWNFRLDPDETGDLAGWASGAWKDGFRTLSVPGSWESQGVTDANPHLPNAEMPYDGTAWYQREIEIPEELRGKELYLEMGAVDDCDWTYFNGRLIGKIGKETPGWYAAKRLYRIPEDAIQFGKRNLICVKVLDTYMGGGIVSGPVRVFVKKDKEGFPYLEDSSFPRHDPYLFQRW